MHLHLTKTNIDISMIAAAIASTPSAPNVDKGAQRYGHHTQKIQTTCTGALHAKGPMQRRIRKRRNDHWIIKDPLLT